MRDRTRFFCSALTFVILGLGVPSCAFNQQVNVNSAQTPTSSATSLPSKATSLPTNQPTLLTDYERLSPTQIRKDGIIFEVLAKITQIELEFEVNARGTLPASFFHGNIVNDLKIAFLTPGPTLALEEYGGGGGIGIADGGYVASQGFDYRITPPVAKGEKIYVTAIITFSQFIGIPSPVKFDLDLVVE